MKFVSDPLAELATAKSAFIRQKIELFEIMTGCETPNRYHVSVTNGNNETVYLFKAREDSGWCTRNCVS